jgi:hypothetical protein
MLSIKSINQNINNDHNINNGKSIYNNNATVETNVRHHKDIVNNNSQKYNDEPDLSDPYTKYFINNDEQNNLECKNLKDIIHSFYDSSSISPNIFEHSDDPPMTNNPFIDNTFNFANIPPNQYDQFIDNAITDEKKIAVNFHKDKFKFMDISTNQNIGSFNIDHLIKYVSAYSDKEEQFLMHINKSKYVNSVSLIKNFVCRVEYNLSLKLTTVNLIDYTESPFMGDIEMLMIINNSLRSFEKSRLDSELRHVRENYRCDIEQSVKQLIYMFLSYTLGLISIISKSLKNVAGKEDLKKHLMEYTIGIVFRISQFIQTQLKIIAKQNKEIKNSIIINLKLKNLINIKFKNISNRIENIKNEQNVNSGEFEHSKKKYKNKVLLSSPISLNFSQNGGYEFNNSDHSKIITFSENFLSNKIDNYSSPISSQDVDTEDVGIYDI